MFIEWDAPSELHPGAVAAQHDVTPRGIAWIEVAAERGALSAWLGHHDLPLRIIEGPPALSAVAISTVTGEVVLR